MINKTNKRKPYKKRELPKDRLCKVCNQVKLIDQFYPHRHKCKSCMHQYYLCYIKKIKEKMVNYEIEATIEEPKIDQRIFKLRYVFD